jgi:hypothetical protein
MVRARSGVQWFVLLWAAALGCISVVNTQKEVKDPKTPSKLVGATAPELEPTAVSGVKKAKLDVPDVYYDEARERWFRWALDDWFEAFLWNGQWFPVEKGKLPPEIAKLEPSREVKKERKLTRKEELQKIDEELRRIEAEEKASKGAEKKDK